MKPNQIPLPGVPVPKREVLILNGEPGIDFVIDCRDWPMPPVRPWEPRPRELSVWERVRGVMG